MKKPEKFNFSGAREMTPEEMRAMKASDSGSGSEGTTIPASGSGSGTGGTTPPPTPDPTPGGSGSGSWLDEAWDAVKDFFSSDAEKERNRQKKACEGKGQGSICNWPDNGGSLQSGVCSKEYITNEIYCAANMSGVAGSATGGFSAREAACLNKTKLQSCEFRADNGAILSGTCRINNWHFIKYPLFCSSSMGSRSGENPNSTNSEESK